MWRRGRRVHRRWRRRRRERRQRRRRRRQWRLRALATRPHVDVVIATALERARLRTQLEPAESTAVRRLGPRHAPEGASAIPAENALLVRTDVAAARLRLVPLAALPRDRRPVNGGLRVGVSHTRADLAARRIVASDDPHAVCREHDRCKRRRSGRRRRQRRRRWRGRRRRRCRGRRRRRLRRVRRICGRERRRRGRRRWPGRRRRRRRRRVGRRRGGRRRRRWRRRGRRRRGRRRRRRRRGGRRRRRRRHRQRK